MANEPSDPATERDDEKVAERAGRLPAIQAAAVAQVAAKGLSPLDTARVTGHSTDGG